MGELSTLDHAVKSIGLVTSRASDLCSSFVLRYLRDAVAPVLWPDGAAPPVKEGLFWNTASCYQKKRIVLVSNDENNNNNNNNNKKKKKKKKNEK